ncbi:helix-turn-helix transcriptional regulator [Streptomyces marincola]|uniref:helix-turn-helix transcriptional regulator n=1 Tax=Streptomyces marincola TaxID=2878388 RepID=UPI001CF4D992|nr:helix-turn-helix transcriptional regulator [Streptomyces marincola]UCM91861.1 helix-turn-helix transcriptional regulator [Streptomyces marincola]
MDREWSGALDLGAVAAHAGYSRYHFVRVFRAAYGRTPGQYLTLRRVERAQELLRCADLSVTEICDLVGFHSLGTFSATFKRHTGRTPTAYRAAHAGRGAALIPGCYALLWAGGFPGRGGEATSGAIAEKPQAGPPS